MSKLPSKPQRGEKALQSIYNTVCQICDYLPTLNVVGDNKTTYVNHSAGGQVVHAIQPNTILPPGNGQTYYAGSGIVITSGNIINAKLSAGPNIKLDYNSGWIVISGTPAGSGEIPPSPGGLEYIGDGNLGSGHIFVDNTATPNPIICSNLYWISDLNNLPFVESSNIVMPNSLTACNNTVDISQVGQIYSNHFIQTRDILYNGLGTKVSLAWMRNPFGDQSEEGTNGIVEGLQVDLTLSGGRYTDVVLHKHVYGALDPNTGTRYDPPTESRVDCLITASGFIDVVPVQMEDGKTWGIISTNLHAGSGITIDPQTGEISCDGGGGGTTIIASGVGYPDHSKLFPDNYPAMSGIGISWLIPVSAGVEYRFYTDATGGEDEEENTIQVAYGKFAPSVGETGTASSLTNGDDFIPDSNGWVRISVFDSGRNEGSCLRFYVNDEDGQYATPLYRFHGFTNYQAGAGIAINSGIISCMIQPGQGLTSTALYDGNYDPYHPRPITGIAFDLSSNFYSDLTIINNRGVNKVLSSGEHGNLTWATNVTPTNKFFAPDYAKLPTTDAGETALGLGNTYVVPVKSGNTIHYSTDGGVVVAQWLPCEGSNTAIKDVPSSTPYLTTTEDGFVRISVIDPGTISAGCVRLIVNNKELPLHKFAKFNYSSGAIYDGGRYIDIQTTSTRINAETELEEEYQLEHPIINNMLTGGTWITIQQTEMVGGVEQELEYPRINCDLSEGTNIEITSAGIINCTLTGLDQLSNTPGYITDTGIPTPVANKVLSTNNSNQMVWATNTSSGGGGGGGMPWPNYANLDNTGGSMIMLKTRYQAGSAGGWLRISYKGDPVDDCYYVSIGPDGNNDPQIGLWRVSTYAYGNGEIGNTWLLPVPPDNYFYVSFPSNVASAWFDSSLGESSPSSVPPSAINYGNDIANNYGTAVDLRSEAEGYMNEALSKEDYWDADEYAGYAQSSASEANNKATDSETKNAELITYGITAYTTLVENTRAVATQAQEYATSARTYANSLPH